MALAACGFGYSWGVARFIRPALQNSPTLLVPLPTLLRVVAPLINARTFSCSPGLYEGRFKVKGKVTGLPLSLSVRLPGVVMPQYLLAKGHYVGQVIDAVIAKFKLDTAPQNLQLLKLDGSIRTPLVPTQTLSEADVTANSEVEVEVIAQVPMTPLKGAPPHLISLKSNPVVDDLYGLMRDDHMTEFYTAVCAAKPLPAAEGMSLWQLYSSSDASLPLLWPLSGHKVLLERDFFCTLLSDEKWLGGLPRDGPQRKLAVLGQPGIGKTPFGWWLVTQLLRAGRTVVYSHNSAKLGAPALQTHYVFHLGVALQTVLPELGAAKHLLADPSVVHICDSCQPWITEKCHQIMLTTPDPDLWRWFVNKEFANLAYVPLYSAKELEVLRAAEFGDVLPASVVALRVKAWGPVPRQVFSKRQSAVRDDIVLSLSNSNLAELQRARDDVDRSMVRRPTDHSPHSLFLLHADRATLRPGPVSFRSDAVGRRILGILAAHQHDSLIRGNQQLLASRTTKLMCNLFDIAVLDSFEHGGSFSCRRLGDSTSLSPVSAKKNAQALTSAAAQLVKTRVVKLKAVRTVPFDTLESVKQGCGAWPLETHRFVPDSPNLASIDSIEVGLRLLQITTKHASHALTVTSGRSEKEGLAAIAETLLPLMGSSRWGGDNVYLEVFFVVPEGCAAMFGLQKLEFFDFSKSKTSGSDSSDTQAVSPIVPAKTDGMSSSRVARAEPVEGCPSSFRILSASGGKPVTVDVRQFVLEVPLLAYRATGDSTLSCASDTIDEAGET